MDGKHNRRSKAAFSQFSGVVCRPKKSLQFFDLDSIDRQFFREEADII